MSRGLDPAIVAELAKDRTNETALVEIHLSTPLFMTTFRSPINVATGTSNGVQTFRANGNFIGFGSYTEQTGLVASKLYVSLSGVSRSILDVFLNDEYLEKKIVIYDVNFDDNFNIVDAPVNAWEGDMQSYSIDETKNTSRLIITCLHVVADHDDIECRRTNSVSQQRHFRGDLGFDFVANIEEENAQNNQSG